jgi:hypothetical protein
MVTRGIALLLLLGAGATGLASAEGPVGAAQGDRERAVERTVRAAVYAAVRHHNYQRACRFATARGRERLLAGFNSSSGPDYPDCPTLIAAEVESYPLIVRRLRRDLVVDVLRASPTRARVRVAEGSGPFDGSGHLALVKAGGHWRLDNSDLIPYGD